MKSHERAKTRFLAIAPSAQQKINVHSRSDLFPPSSYNVHRDLAMNTSLSKFCKDTGLPKSSVYARCKELNLELVHWVYERLW